MPPDPMRIALRRSEAALIADPTRWPHRPRLPLMRRVPRGARPGDMVDCGYLVEGCGLSVFLGNMLMPPPTGQVEVFTTIELLLLSWRID